MPTPRSEPDQGATRQRALSWLEGLPPCPPLDSGPPASGTPPAIANLETGGQKEQTEQVNPFVKALYDDRLQWYKDVQARTQLTLAITAIFTGFVTGTLLDKATDVRDVISAFGWDTWLFASLMGLALTMTLLLNVLSFLPRIKRNDIQTQVRDARGQHPYPKSVMWWFVHVGCLDRQRFTEEAATSGPDFFSQVLADQVWVLSQHLERKYRLFRRASFWLAGALIAFVATTASYLFHIATAPTPTA